MCGRARCSLSRDEIRAQARVNAWNGEEAYNPSYNVSPSRSTPVLKQGTANGERELHTMKWGLIPSYTKPNDSPDFFRMFNARSETVAEKGVFSKLLSRQRCIVYMNGFYEWKKEGTIKQPYFIYQDGRAAMQMAGLYDAWKTATGDTVYSFTILTTDSSEKLTWLHDRMPVILPDQEAVETWLTDKDTILPGAFKTLCEPYNAEDLHWFPVDPKMNNARVDSPEVCQPLKRRPITAFFKTAGAQKETPEKKVKQETIKQEDTKTETVKQETEGRGAIKSEADVSCGEGSEQPVTSITHAQDGADLAAEDVNKLQAEESNIKPEEGNKLKKEYGSNSPDQKSPQARKDTKRPAPSPQSQQRSVKPKSAEKGKITSFFTKNAA